jgi:hypothetical protein
MREQLYCTRTVLCTDANSAVYPHPPAFRVTVGMIGVTGDWPGGVGMIGLSEFPEVDGRVGRGEEAQTRGSANMAKQDSIIFTKRQ